MFKLGVATEAENLDEKLEEKVYILNENGELVEAENEAN